MKAWNLTILQARPQSRKSRALKIFFVVAALFAIGQFHRFSGAVVMPAISEDLAIPAHSLSLIAAALFFTASLMQIPIGILLDWFGARKMLPVFVVFGVVGSFLFAAADSYGEVLFARIFVGAGYSVVMMAAYVLFARWYGANRFATMASWFTASASVGGLMGTLPLAAFQEIYGWRMAFNGIGLLTFALMLYGMWIIRDAPPDYKELHDRPSGLRQSLGGFWQVIRYPGFLSILGMGSMAYAPAITLIGMWGGPYLQEIHALNGFERGQVIFLMTVLVPLGALVFGPMDRIFKSRKRVVMGAGALQVIFLASLGVSAGANLILVVALMVSIAFTQQYYVVLSAHCRATFPDHLVGRANSTLNLVAILGVGTMQSGFGLVIAIVTENFNAPLVEAYRAGFLFMAAFMALALLLYSRSRDVPLD